MYSKHNTGQRTHIQAKRYTLRGRRIRNVVRSPEGKNETVVIFRTAIRCPSRYRKSR